MFFFLIKKPFKTLRKIEKKVFKLNFSENRISGGFKNWTLLFSKNNFKFFKIPNILYKTKIKVSYGTFQNNFNYFV